MMTKLAFGALATAGKEALVALLQDPNVVFEVQMEVVSSFADTLTTDVSYLEGEVALLLERQPGMTPATKTAFLNLRSAAIVLMEAYTKEANS
jgi:hypothetical protein